MLIPFLGVSKSEVAVTQMELGVTQSHVGVAQVELNVTHLGAGVAHVEVGSTQSKVGSTQSEVGSAQLELGLGAMFEMFILAEHFESDVKLVEIRSLLDLRGLEDAFHRQDCIPDLPTIMEDWKSSEENCTSVRSTMLPFERGVIGELIEHSLGLKDGKFE